MSHLIDSALLSSFDAGSFGLPIASENRPYDPQPGTAWAQLFVVHAQPSIATMGSGGQDEITGFLQVNLNYPEGSGGGAAKQKATAIRDYFTAGTKHSYGGVDVYIANAGRSASFNIDSWYRLVVTINWYTRLTR